MWDRFLRACRGEPVDSVPVWFMRQAGRYLPEYRALRERYSLLELCRTPELAAQITLLPVTALGVDAAIIFADILLPLAPMGARFDFAAAEGPVFERPLTDAREVDELCLIDPHESLAYVLEAIRMVRGELDRRTPVIGFAGAPFTLACYLIEGRKSQDFLRVKRLMYDCPSVFESLLGRLAEVTARYLLAQVEAGAQAVQLFDSWAGVLAPADYRQFVLPATRSVLLRVTRADVPSIYFTTGTAGWLELVRQAGGSVLGVDWRVDLGEVKERVGPEVPLQGNLDPALLFAPRALLAERVTQVLKATGGRAHVFNLGHGVLPETSPDQLGFVVDQVHNWQPGCPGE